MASMDIQLIEKLNDLWRPIYPYLAQWIGQLCPIKKGWILELGPFSGGISEAMQELVPDIRAVCLMHQKELILRVRKQFHRKVEYSTSPMDAFPFEDKFKIIISRGAFFFLTPEIIKESYRALGLGSSALLGGGYGPLTPEKEIRRIAEESKELNDRLGKKWLSKGELGEMVGAAGLAGSSHIIEEGGLWLLLNKAV
jgi:hypothetical protein